MTSPTCRGEVAIFGAGLHDHQNAMTVRDRMLELGVVTRAIGTETLTFCPPFVTTDEQVDRIVDVLATALSETAARCDQTRSAIMSV